MKKNLQKYILSILMGSLVLSLVAVPVSAQIQAEACLTSSQEPGSFRGGICIATGGGQGQGGQGGGQPGGGAPLYQQGNFNLSIISNLINQVQNLLAQGVPLLIGAAVLWFIWNLFTFFTAEDATKKSAALNKMMMGLAAIFVMVSIWGIIRFFSSVTGIQQGGGADLPGLPTYQQ